MKKIYHYLKEFIIDDFNLKTYLFSSILIILAIYINYFSDLKGKYFTFEEYFSEINRPKNLLYYCYLPFYGIPYFLVLWVKLHNENQLKLLQNPEFWLKIGFGLFVLCFSGGFYFSNEFVANFSFDRQYIIKNFVYGGYWFVTSTLLIAIFYFAFDSKNPPFFYGFTAKGFEAKPYLIMLGIVAPFVFLASSTSDFTDQYPTLSAAFIQDSFGFSKNTIIGFYELLYLVDFINLEILMRGFLIIGMAKILGRHAILPTTIIYFLLHFEKPIGEAISSIFGGYILSVIAFRTNSILGGCMVHIGIAGLMELFAFYQIFLNDK